MGVARLAALAGAIALVAACSSRMGGAIPGREGPLAYAGPAGWEIRVLQQPPPYGLAQYVEPRIAGIPDASRGFLLVGKSYVRAGSNPLAGACEDQWAAETRSEIPPTGRRPLRTVRGGMTCTGWEAKRTLPDGTPMRLRTLCGARETRSVYLYLSAPDRSLLYDPMWESLLQLNVDQE